MQHFRTSGFSDLRLRCSVFNLSKWFTTCLVESFKLMQGILFEQRRERPKDMVMIQLPIWHQIWLLHYDHIHYGMFVNTDVYIIYIYIFIYLFNFTYSIHGYNVDDTRFIYLIYPYIHLPRKPTHSTNRLPFFKGAPKIDVDGPCLA